MLDYHIENKAYLSQIETIKKELNKLQRQIFLKKDKGLIIILQGVDAAGKDGIIKHILSDLSPVSCSTKAFKTPTEAESAHDYLWRIHKEVPPLGHIKIFNRSHYEDVIVPKINNKNISTKKRINEIKKFEKYLKENNIYLIKFFLHISKDEQYKRLKQRESDPSKHWKVDKKDWNINKKWNKVMKIYQKILNQTNHWNIIPTNDKYTARVLVGNILIKKIKKIIS